MPHYKKVSHLNVTYSVSYVTSTVSGRSVTVIAIIANILQLLGIIAIYIVQTPGIAVNIDPSHNIAVNIGGEKYFQ